MPLRAFMVFDVRMPGTNVWLLVERLNALAGIYGF